MTGQRCLLPCRPPASPGFGNARGHHRHTGTGVGMQQPEAAKTKSHEQQAAKGQPRLSYDSPKTAIHGGNILCCGNAVKTLSPFRLVVFCWYWRRRSEYSKIEKPLGKLLKSCIHVLNPRHVLSLAVISSIHLTSQILKLFSASNHVLPHYLSCQHISSH